MKKVFFLLGLASLVVVACMVYLLKTGISLSPAVLIRPSPFTSQEVVLEAAVKRLFPYFSQYKEWSVIIETPDMQQSGEQLKKDILRAHPQLSVQVIAFTGENAPLRVLSSQTITVSSFVQSEYLLSESCKNMKRLNYRCFKEVSLHKSRRKFKDPEQNYFMMTSYVDTHFLLLQQRRDP